MEWNIYIFMYVWKQDFILFPVRVECTQADMLITFLFGTPFEGRVYSTGNPQVCFEMGNGQPQIVLRIPMGTQCGTVQQVSIMHYQMATSHLIIIIIMLYLYVVLMLNLTL
jgi:hypothetical protein